MNWTDDLNRAMNYIEENLRGEVSIAEVARRATCSEFHLQRMFPYMTGMTLADYIRRRRMSLAALDLAAGGKVIDVALRYGYESPTSFSRAFRDVHGVTPSEAQRGTAKLTQYPRLAFTMQVKGEEAMEYKIKEQGDFRVVGHLAEGDWALEDAGEKASEFWAFLNENGGKMIHDVLSLMDGSEPNGLLGVSFCESGSFSGYLVGVATNAPCPEDMEERIVPAATYAVFDCTGPMPDAMQNLQHRIFAEWLPSSGYEWAPKSDLEVYFGPRMTAEDYKSQVWIPIEKRQA
jgi:AraC family transcriptional regulator